MNILRNYLKNRRNSNGKAKNNTVYNVWFKRRASVHHICTWSMWGCDQHSTHLRHDRVGVSALGLNAKIVVTAVSTSYDSEEAEFTLANQTYYFANVLNPHI